MIAALPHFMRMRRTLPVVLAVVIVAAAVTVTVQLRKNAPPEAARLLPSADTFLYANLAWMRKANVGNPLPAVSHDPDYEHFIQETGFDFERDLEAIALAVHYPEKWPGGGTTPAGEPRYSEVMTGRFDGNKCVAYLKRMATSVENYRGVDIYTIPVSGRSFRIAILAADTVAASNHDDAAVIHGMVDRSRRLASPFAGPAFLRRYYKHVQLASPVWAVARVQPSAPEFEGWSAVFPRPADLVISASANPLHLPLRAGALHLRAEAWTTSDDDAHKIAEKLGVFLTLFRNAEASVGTGGSDADVKALFSSLQVHQEGNRAVLNATVPPGFLRKFFTDTPSLPVMPSPEAAGTEPANSH